MSRSHVKLVDTLRVLVRKSDGAKLRVLTSVNTGKVYDRRGKR
jgi:hypothetical protein